MKKTDLTSYVIYAVPVLLMVGLIGWVVLAPEDSAGDVGPSLATEDTLKSCVNHGGISMHIHPELKIFVNGAEQIIPANVGVEGSCMHPVHTHDTTGKIHLEYPVQKDFLLKDFFTLWGQTFTKDELMGNKVDATHRIRMTVDGVESTEFENLLMKDLQKIELFYEEIPAE